MNYALVLQIIGRLCALLGSILLAMALFALFSPNDSARAVWGFAGTGLLALVLWLASVRLNVDNRHFRAPEGFACVTLGWFLMGFLGALPFLLSGTIPSLTDSFFESVSGFTTTGASILREVETLPDSMLLWRSLTQWLGGMGIVALFVALLPALGAGGNFLFQAEVPGPTPGRIRPRISETAKTLWFIYLGLTLIQIVLLCAAGMSLFDSINHSFTTLSTGGFSTRNESLGAFGPSIQWIVTLFMFLGGINFAMHFLLLHKQWRIVWRNEEVRLYAGIVVVAVVLVTASLWAAPDDASDAVPDTGGGTVRHAAFQVVSILTTTGFGSADFDQWPGLCRILLVVLMFLGGCAGSTAGGIKLSRVIVLSKYVQCQVRRVLHPSAVLLVKLGRRTVEPAIVDGTLGFFLLFVTLFTVGSLALLGLGSDPTTALSSTIACLSNIGPGLGDVGPAANYADVHTAGKWLLSLLMLLGRLEIYSVILLFVPSLWEK